MATFHNRATLSYNENLINSNVTAGEIPETLSMTKTAVTPTYNRNDRITYIINLVNSGSAPFTGLTLTDDLGAYAFNGGTVVPLDYRTGSVRYFVNGVLQTAPTVSAGCCPKSVEGRQISTKEENINKRTDNSFMNFLNFRKTNSFSCKTLYSCPQG